MGADWIEITATGPGEKSAEATAALIGAGSPGVLEAGGVASSQVGRLLTRSEWVAREPDQPASFSATVSLKAYLPADEPERLGPLQKELKGLGWSFSTEPFKDRDWSVKWRAGLKPVRITSTGSSVIVKPSWCVVTRKPGDIVIEMDPGMAFGTGSHATTKMCLKAIKTLMASKKGLRTGILDVGTGTGVLAIAAMKLKAKKAVAIDIDEVALKVARKNIRANRVSVTLSRNPVERVPGLFSIVVANILAGELIRLSPAISAKVMPGGYLVLSGILREEAETVGKAYAAAGLKLTKKYLFREWAALVMNKPPGA